MDKKNKEVEVKNKRVELVIRGDVQGVSYRYFARDIAKKMGVKGWIRNESEGSITAVIEGDDERVDNFVNWCRQGSPMSTVEGVDLTDSKYSGLFKDFEIK